MTTPIIDQEPVRVSWSRIRVYEECRMRAQIQRTHKGREGKDIRGFFRGTVVDRVLRDWLDNPIPGAMVDMVKSRMDYEETLAADTGDGVVRWKHARDKQDSIAWCVRLVKKLEPIMNELVLPYEYMSSQAELKFAAPVTIPGPGGVPTKIILNGEMDLLVKHPNGRYACWDLKATENNQYWKKVQGQLVFYDIATMCKYGEQCEVTGLIQPMADPPVMPFTFAVADHQVMWQRIIKYCEGIWAERLTPQPDLSLCTDNKSLCGYCDEKHACPLYTTTTTDRKGKKRAVGLNSPVVRSTDA